MYGTRRLAHEVSGYQTNASYTAAVSPASAAASSATGVRYTLYANAAKVSSAPSASSITPPI